MVHYWLGRAVGSDDVSGYEPNDEIDGCDGCRARRHARLLTYDYDRETLAEALSLPRNTRALVVLRHAQGPGPRKSWKKDDRLRPLLALGQQQAQRLVPLLAAYDVAPTRVPPAAPAACRPLTPYAERVGWP